MICPDCAAAADFDAQLLPAPNPRWPTVMSDETPAKIESADGSAPKPYTDRQRELFWSKVDKSGDCWLWTAATTKGYGRVNGRQMAHRVAYEELVGAVPEDHVLDHRCHSDDLGCPGGECIHRRCVNPDHLEPVTQRENVMRGRGLTAELARRTTCKEGHPLAQSGPKRRCRKCTNRSLEASRQRRRAAFAAGQLAKPPAHGTTAAYGLGCKCDPCRAAGRAKRDAAA